MTLVELLGIASAVCLLVALWARPVGLFGVVFAFAIVGAAILISWNDIAQVRAQRAQNSAFQTEQANSSSAVTVPLSRDVRAGS
jgi:hypothetical protein